VLGVTGPARCFAIALLASGQNSTLTGTLAGQSSGRVLNIRLRRGCAGLITRSLPSSGGHDTAISGEKARPVLLVLSQVILSCNFPLP